MSKQIFTTYWGGYFDTPLSDPQTLDMTPDYIDYVILAFIGPIKDSTVETTYLCSKYSESQIKEWIQVCHQKNIKVFFSILDTPQTHWDQIDLHIFAKSIKQKMIEWDIDGIDIDAESGMPEDVYVKTFIELANELYLILDGKPLIYTCYQGIAYQDGKILTAIKDKLNWIQLMAYFDTYTDMIALYQDYSTIMGNNICIGVKAGNPDITLLPEVAQLSQWNPNKKGMMLWTINRDIPYYTDKPNLTWANTINENINISFYYTLFYLMIYYTISQYLHLFANN